MQLIEYGLKLPKASQLVLYLGSLGLYSSYHVDLALISDVICDTRRFTYWNLGTIQPHMRVLWTDYCNPASRKESGVLIFIWEAERPNPCLK